MICRYLKFYLDIGCVFDKLLKSGKYLFLYAKLYEVNIMITRFGTSKEMVLQSIEENDISLLLAIDTKGLYLTLDKYVDKNLADPNRYSASRTTVVERLKALGMDYKEVFEANKASIQGMSIEAKKKVNPLKASKRSVKK